VKCLEGTRLRTMGQIVPGGDRQLLLRKAVEWERTSHGDVTLTRNTALYSSRRHRVSKKISDLACAKASLASLINDYTQLM
jgi:hypothetical protein